MAATRFIAVLAIINGGPLGRHNVVLVMMAVDKLLLADAAANLEELLGRIVTFAFVFQFLQVDNVVVVTQDLRR
jgi:hypothetical protein